MNLPKQSGTGMMQSVVSIYPVAVLIWGKYSNREMNIRRFFLLLCNLVGYALGLPAQQTAVNPLIYADVPDMSMVRVDDTYYMSSTTMHMVPGVPIMKSKDLVNWELVSYAYDRLTDDVPAMNLDDGQNTYGRDSWASCIRYHKGMYYVSTFAQTTGKTYFFMTRDIEKGPWKRVEFAPSCHDHTFFFDEDGRNYLIYGNGKLFIAELEADLSGLKTGTERVLLENASAPAGGDIMLGAEGSQLFKVDGRYYLFNITWPRNGMRTVVVHRADKITGPYEGRVVFQDRGIAQGGLVDTPDGRWFAYLFQDCGAVGRIPYLVPVQWEDGWPVLGVNGVAPDKLELPAGKGLIPGIVCSDEFVRKAGEADLPLVWQWNHNPDNALWSVSARKGYLRLTTGRLESSFMQAKGTLTQRTIGPVCSGSVCMDASGMKDGDFAGLSLFQHKYGQVGVKIVNGEKCIVMVNGELEEPVEVEKIPLSRNRVYFKAECDFRDRKDIGYFYYSLNGKEWKPLGSPLKMEYTLPHFMGYRFALFNYAAKEIGGYADFDYFRIEDSMQPADTCRDVVYSGISAYFSPIRAGGAQPDAEGFIRRWLLLEPIAKPNRSNAVFTDSYIRKAFTTEYFPNQFTVLPEAGAKVRVGNQKLTWHALDSKNFNVKLFRFAHGLDKNVYGVLFWAVAVVNCAEDINNVRMAVGSNSASMWWLNGEEAIVLSGDRRMVKDDCVSPRLTLKKGKNIVRGAVINGPGMSDFCVRFLDEKGQPVRNISVSCK